MIKKITLFAFSVAACSVAVAQSFTATYTFDSVNTSSGLIDPTPVPTATGVTFGSFASVGGTATNPNATGRFTFTNWPLGGVPNNNTYSAHTGTITTTQYYEVTVTPDNGFDATLTSVKFRVQRSSAGIRTYSVRSSADSYAANLPASISPANANLSVQADSVFYYNYDSLSNGQSGNILTLSGAAYTNFTTPITFRFYAWNAEQTGGTFSIDSVIFDGSVTALTTGISTSANSISPVIYPNPSTDGLFTINNIAGKTEVTVYDIVGKVVYTTEISAGNKSTLDLSSQVNGSYFVRVKNTNGVTTKKVIVNK